MTAPDAKRARIKQKISASEARLRREGDAPARKQFPDRDPPETYRSLAGEYPWAAIIGGVALGVLAGSLLPKVAGSKLGRRTLALATLAGELGLTFSKQARDKAGEVGRDGIARLGDLSESVGENATELRQRAGDAAGRARSRGLDLAGRAVKLAARVRR